MIISAQKLQSLAKKIFLGMTCSTQETSIITNHLVTANLMGHDSHGVGMIPIYVKSFHANILFPNMIPECVKNDGNIVIYDGKRGFGQSIANVAMTEAIKKCKASGLVLLGINNSGHMGRIGTYGEQCAAKGLVSIHFVNVIDRSPSVAPYNGAKARFGTNPVCIAMPMSKKKNPIVLDFATSKVAVGKIRVAINKGEELPEGLVIDHKGHPSKDPRVLEQHIYPHQKSDIQEGAVLPMGEYKGFGLSLFCEILGGILSGGKTIQPDHKRLGGVINNMMSIIINPSYLVKNSFLNDELNSLIEYIKSSPSISEDSPVVLPGEIEQKTMDDRLKNGIPIDDETFEQILKAGDSLNINRFKF